MTEPRIIIVGLGPGDPGLITRKAWETLCSASTIFLRTSVHPTVAHLPEGVTCHSFDSLYETEASFEDVYDSIVSQLVERVITKGEVVYAVPGDPMNAEGTVTRLLAVARRAGIAIDIVSGVSFIEPSMALLEMDAVPGLQLLDATDIASAYHPPINPNYPALIAQVYSRQLANDVKLTLMNQYPDDHPVSLVHGAGAGDARVDKVRLFEVDWQDCSHLTSLYVPPLQDLEEQVVSFEGFQNTIAHLRAPDGCPWDREQTHQSLRNNLLEETYEVIDAIDAGEPDKLAEELGDLLLQIVLHTQIAIDEGEFNMADVIGLIDDKIKRRHPHVWGDVDVNGESAQVAANWEAIKAEERKNSGDDGFKSALDGISKAMPALAQTFEYDTRAARFGFDWENKAGVIEKVREEMGELLSAETEAEKFHEIGDLLLVVAVWARWLKQNPEDALRAANRRFYDRFTYIEKHARQGGRNLSDMTLDEMNALWDERKNQVRGDSTR